MSRAAVTVYRLQLPNKNIIKKFKRLSHLSLYGTVSLLLILDRLKRIIVSRLMEILFLGRHSTSYMAFRLVKVQDYPSPIGEGGVDLCKTFRNVFMYG